MIQIDPAVLDGAECTVLYRNVLAEGTLAASSETADGAGANAIGPQTFDYWTPAAVPATLAVTLPAPVECSAAALVAHTLGTSGATVAVQYFDGAVWVTAATLTPTNDDDILMLFPKVTAAQWQILVTGAVASIGVAMIGPRFIIPFGVANDYTPMNLGLVIENSPAVSRGGHFIGTRIKTIGATTTVNLAQQDREWIETTAVEFIAHYNSGQPFIWAASPAVLTDDLSYVWRVGDTLRVSYGPGALLGSLSLDLAGYLGGLTDAAG